jgi:nucleotide-binding universal stress UspA family protein
MSPDAETDRPVLFAYDGSDQARAAIAEAGRLLRTGRTAIVLAVFQPLGSIPFWGTPYARVPASVIEEAEEQAGKVAAEGAALATDAGFEAEPAVIEGAEVWERIVEAAEQHGAGLIVIGSHGRTAPARLVMGSVAASVAHHAGIPVLICRES